MRIPGSGELPSQKNLRNRGQCGLLVTGLAGPQHPSTKFKLKMPLVSDFACSQALQVDHRSFHIFMTKPVRDGEDLHRCANALSRRAAEFMEIKSLAARVSPRCAVTAATAGSSRSASCSGLAPEGPEFCVQVASNYCQKCGFLRFSRALSH